jgi:hypothetical protein
METKEFTIVHLHNLKIDDLFSLNKSTIEYADPVKENIGVMPKIILARLVSDNLAMQQQMNKALKNVLTPQLTEMNADREDRTAEIKRNVTTALKGRDFGKKSAAENLKVFLDPYWETNQKAMNTQTGILSEMFGKYNNNAELKAYAVTIGISQMMTELETANTMFNQVYQNRLVQEAASEGPAATSLRAAATKSYAQFCMAVEQAVNFMPTEVLTTLFNQLDELRKTYARLVHTKEEEPEASPEPVQ